MFFLYFIIPILYNFIRKIQILSNDLKFLSSNTLGRGALVLCLAYLISQFNREINIFSIVCSTNDSNTTLLPSI